MCFEVQTGIDTSCNNSLLRSPTPLQADVIWSLMFRNFITQNLAPDCSFCFMALYNKNSYSAA